MTSAKKGDQMNQTYRQKVLRYKFRGQGMMKAEKIADVKYEMEGEMEGY